MVKSHATEYLRLYMYVAALQSHQTFLITSNYHI